jgi:hypothetical protein
MERRNQTDPPAATAPATSLMRGPGSLRQHAELILNYFRAQNLICRGVVKGLNNKATRPLRKSYGCRTYRVLELALYDALGNLPEPGSTHYLL